MLAAKRQKLAIRTPLTASSALRNLGEHELSHLVLNIPSAYSVIKGSSSDGIVANVMPVNREDLLSVTTEVNSSLSHVLS